MWGHPWFRQGPIKAGLIDWELVAEGIWNWETGELSDGLKGALVEAGFGHFKGAVVGGQ